MILIDQILSSNQNKNKLKIKYEDKSFKSKFWSCKFNWRKFRSSKKKNPNSSKQEEGDSNERPLLKAKRQNRKLIISGDPHLLTIKGSETEVLNELDQMDMDAAFRYIEGNKKYFIRLIIQAALAMFSASVTTYALGYYEALPTFKCQ